MDWNALLEGNGIVAWGVAFLLAVGGTAVVVAAWLQFRTGWRHLPRRWQARRPAAAAAPAPVARARTEVRLPGRAVAAYRDQAEAAPAPTAPRPAAPPSAAPAVPALTTEALDSYLRRLHRAVNELESAAAS